MVVGAFLRLLGSRAVRVFLVVAIVVFALAVAAQAQAGGVDCDCDKTGDYKDPATGKNLDISSDGTSSDGKYRVTATSGGANGRAILTVERVATNEVVLNNVQATNWGFSPDEDRFVYHYVTSGAVQTHIVVLYDLSQSPARKVKEINAVTGSSRIQFSPTGKYFFYSYLGTNGQANLQIIDSVSGDTSYSTAFSFQTVPGEKGDKFGVAGWGFGPGDRSFVYAYKALNDSIQWNLVNLESGQMVHDESLLASSAFWQFSPCGNVIGLVQQPNQTQVGVRLFETMNGDAIQSQHQTFNLASVQLRSTADSHIANVGGTDYTLAPNNAGDSCGGGGGPTNDPPTADFTPPQNARAKIPASFTDTSEDADGTIAARLWNFGDGGASTQKDPTHTYQSAGTYTVSLEVTDDDGDTDTDTKQLAVAANDPPQASFTQVPESPVKGDAVTFTDTSTDDDGISSRSWSVDGSYDGSFFTSDEEISLKLCESVDVSLTVSDNADQSDTETKTIQVADRSDEIQVSVGGSLADAVAKACPGDTIVLPAGTFDGGAELRDVSIRGAGMGQTIIQGPADDFVLTTRAFDEDGVAIEDLTLTGGAGGVYVDGSGLTRLLDIEVSHNIGEGGIGIDFSPDLEVRDSHIHHNTNEFGDGGGISMSCCGSVTVTDSEIAFNSAEGNGGGAFPYEADQVMFADNYVHDNSAAQAGGGLVVDSFGDGDIIANNRFVDNSALAGGGFSGGGDVLFAGNLVSGNTGGGVERSGHGGDFEVVNSTIEDSVGPGLKDDLGFGSAVYLANTLVAGNTPDVELAEDSAEPIFSESIIGDDLPGACGYHPTPGAAQVDAGDNDAVPRDDPATTDVTEFTLDKDLHGDDRILDGDGDGTATVDIGHDEVAAVASPAADLSVCKEAAEDTVPAGSDATYEITVANNGPIDASNATVADRLPAELSFVSCEATGGGVCNNSGNDVTVSFPSLPDRQEETVAIVARVKESVPADTAVANTAEVSSSSLADPYPDNDSDTEEVFVSHPAPEVSSVTPEFGNPGESLPLTVAGAKLRDGAAVKLTRDEAEIPASLVGVEASGERLSADVSIPVDAPEGAYEVVVTNDDDQSGALEGGFEVVPPAGSLPLGARPQVVTFGGATNLSGSLLDAQGVPISEQEVALERKPAGSTAYEKVGMTATQTDGAFGFQNIKPQKNTYYRVKFEAEGFEPMTSREIEVRVKVGITLRLSAAALKPGKKAVISGAVSPAHSGKVTLTVKRGKKTVDTMRAPLRGSRYRVAYRPPGPGNYKVIAVFPKDEDHLGDTSAPKRLKVKRR